MAKSPDSQDLHLAERVAAFEMRSEIHHETISEILRWFKEARHTGGTLR